MALPVGIQIYSVGDHASRDLVGTLKALKEMGYDCVELAGLYGLTAKDMRKALREAKIKAVAAHFQLHDVGDDFLSFVAMYKSIGVKYLVFATVPDELRPVDGSDNKEILEKWAYMGRICSEQGIQLAFHNHEWDFEKKVDGLYMLDYLREHLPHEYFQPELDVGWVLAAGIDPVEYMSHFYGYLPLVHAKDFQGTLDESTVEEGKQINRHNFKGFRFCPLGNGNLDLPAVLKASEANYSMYIIVEQDSSEGQDSLECARISRENLKALGW